MIKKIAWEAFKNTGDINTYLELKQIEQLEQIQKEMKENEINQIQDEFKNSNKLN